MIELNIILHNLPNCPTLPACIDSGSSINIIHEDNLPDSLPINRNETILFGTSNNDKVSTLGTILLTIRPINVFATIDPIRPFVFKSKFHVTRTLPVAAIIGMPILKHTLCDYTTNIITFFGHNSKHRFPLTQPDNHNFLTLLAPHENHGLILENHASITRDLQKADEHIESTKKGVTINPDLTPSYKKQFQQIVDRYKNGCFNTDTEKIPLFKHGHHPPLQLPLTSRTYTKPPIYKLAEAHELLASKQINDWLEQGVITEQDRDVPYDCPLLVVPKKDGSARICVDGRAINSIISDEIVFLPRINDIVAEVSGAQIYSSFDISSFFLNFALNRESSDLLTFSHPITKRRYRFLRTPFGIKKSMQNSVDLLQRELDTLDDRHSFLRIYADDGLVFSNSIDKHLSDLNRLFNLFTDLNIRIKPSKTFLGYSKIEAFGYIISSTGYDMSPTRFKALMDLPKPKTRKDLLKVIGKTSYFRTLLPPTKPMGYFTAAFRDLTKTTVKYKWLPRHDALWTELKEAIKSHVKLQKLLPTDDEIIVRSDASQTHYSGTISVIRNGEEILIGTFSKAWSESTSNYHITRLETFAILLNLAHFKSWLIGRKVKVYVDNPKTFFLLKNPHKIQIYGTLIPRLLEDIRWVKFDVFKTDNKDANWALVDKLSRSNVRYAIKSRNMLDILTTFDDPEPTELTMLTKKLDDFQMTEPSDHFKVATNLFNLRHFNKLKEELLNDPYFLKNKTIPKTYRSRILHALHQTGHLGQVRMAAILSNANITWPNRNQEINILVRQCPTCGPFQPNNNHINTSPLDLPDLRPKKTIACDITSIGQPSILNIVVTVDLVTGFMAAKRIPGQLNSHNVATTLLNIIATHFPQLEYLKLDNASYFRSHEFANFLSALGLTPVFVSRSNHRGNGKIERKIRSLQDQLRLMNLTNLRNTANIDLALTISCLLVNNRPLNHGISPFMLMYGHDLTTHSKNLPDIVFTNLGDYQKDLYNRIKDLHALINISHDSPPITPHIELLQVNDVIRIKMPQLKGTNKIQSPIFSKELFRIIKVKPYNNTYEIQNTNNDNDKRRIHSRYCRLYIKGNEHIKRNHELQTLYKQIETASPPTKTTHKYNLRQR